MAHCGPPPEPDPSADTCATVCEHYRSLGCEEGEPTPAGAPCEEFCAQLLDSDITVPAECIVESASCDEARACEEIL